MTATDRRRRLLLLAGAVVLLAAAPAPRPVQVRLNGTPLGAGVVIDDDGEELPLLGVRELRHVVDGPVPPGVSRLRVRGRQLVAIRTGGCPGCAVRVARPVIVSRTLRVVGGLPYIPLRDLARAFDGSLHADRTRTVYTISAAGCRWCILATADATP